MLVLCISKLRVCCDCNHAIPSGSKALTLNVPYKGRRWKCLECVNLLNRVKQDSLQLALTPYDDEGDAMANLEYLEA